MTPQRRSLTQAEIRLLRRDRDRLARQLTEQRRRGVIIFLLIWAVLAAVTTAANRSYAWQTIGCWVISGLAICIPTLANAQRKNSKKLMAHTAAIDAGVCDEQVFEVRRYWEIAELDDEGPVYGFELMSGAVVFVSGQDYRADSKFPSSSFGLTEVRDPKNEVILSWIRKSGKKLRAERVFPSSTKKTLRPFEPMAHVDGPLESAFKQIIE